ncbi:MAG: aspartate aminotransferase family protein [Pseudomonadota bacterium]
MIPSLLPTYNRAPLSFEKGSGAWLETPGGERYLDLAAGIAVNVLGHAHPALVEALTDQASRLWHVSNLYEVPEQQRLADALVDLTFADTVFFTNSGTEACELAVKMARKYWHAKGEDRHEILAFTGSFHGRSTAAIAAAGSEKLTSGFGPLLPGFTQVAFDDPEALDGAFSETLAAIIVEPVQGEGGIVPIPDAVLQDLRRRCDATGALLVLDEVQCGMGRTGKLFAHEWAGITPDIMMVAKGIGGGFPLGAILSTEEAASGMGPGSHGSTYGGNPLAMAVGLKVLQIVSDPDFLDGVRRVSGTLRQRLEGLVAAHPDVFEAVRGSGLMLGLKCQVPNTDVVRAGYGTGVLTVPAGDNVVRILPPLILTEGEVGEAVHRLERAASSLAPLAAE